jgi:hypothetical protein
METCKTLISKVDFSKDSLEVKINIKYQHNDWKRLEDFFEGDEERITEAYDRIANGKSKFLTILVEVEFENMRGTDCMGSVWIDSTYTIQDCVEENKMISRATSDLFNRMELK